MNVLMGVVALSLPEVSIRLRAAVEGGATVRWPRRKRSHLDDFVQDV